MRTDQGPIFMGRCTHGTIKIENGMFIVARGCLQGNAWQVPFASITGIAVGYGAMMPPVTFQTPGGGFTTKMGMKDITRLQQLHAQMLMARQQ